MPKNRFPDSLAKRELRRQDARRLFAFRNQHSLASGFDYCGMPSVEFLDILEWQSALRFVCAVELEEDVLSDMRIQWDRLQLKLPVRFVEANILDFIHKGTSCYDVYNLDFYGGFLHPKQKGAPRCIEAIRSLVSRHGARCQSFVLVCTFNVRDKGFKDYFRFLGEVPKALKDWHNVRECCQAHNKSQVTRLKLCFPYFCWQVGMTHGFVVRFADTVLYHSSVTLLHFYTEFMFQNQALPALTSAEVLAEIASRPLIRMDGMIPRVELRPPQISRE